VILVIVIAIGTADVLLDFFLYGLFLFVGDRLVVQK
jgi:hypothetical protein